MYILADILRNYRRLLSYALLIIIVLGTINRISFENCYSFQDNRLKIMNYLVRIGNPINIKKITMILLALKGQGI